MFPKLPRSMIWCLSLILENSQPLLLQKYLFFLLLLVFPLCMYYTLCNCPTVLFFSILFSVCISVWDVYKDMSSCSVILALAMSSLLISPLKTFFVLVQCVWFLTFPLDIFLEFPPFCLHSPCSPACYFLFFHWNTNQSYQYFKTSV